MSIMLNQLADSSINRKCKVNFLVINFSCKNAQHLLLLFLKCENVLLFFVGYCKLIICMDKTKGEHNLQNKFSCS